MKRLLLVLVLVLLLLRLADCSGTSPVAEYPVEVDSEPPPITYVLNTNTKKFHYPDCASVDDMKEKNRLDVSWDRDEVIEQGYVPCKRCNP